MSPLSSWSVNSPAMPVTTLPATRKTAATPTMCSMYSASASCAFCAKPITKQNPSPPLRRNSENLKTFGE
ncbi:hypothetical protein D3C85_1393350 [compost metagenome]